MAEIVKVQLPIYSSDPIIAQENCALVYGRNRSRIREQSIPHEVFNAVKHNGMKAFYFATFDTLSDRWILEQKAPWQEW